MKTKIFALMLFSLPFLVSAQNLTIASGATVTIGPGASVTTGEITNNAGTGGLVIESVYDMSSGNKTGSLIYTNAGTEPDATVEVYVKEDGWHFVSSPVGNTTSDVFLPVNSDPVWLAEYQMSVDPADQWSYITATDATINKGQGYSYAVNYSSKADNNVNFTGKLVSQLFTSPTLNHQDNVNTNPNNFTLLGNPFSCPLNVALFDPTETDFELTVWIWDQTLNDGSGGYQWASFYNDYEPPGEMSPVSIAIGQGFFVRALTSSATIDFDPALRQHESGVKYFKEGDVRNENIEAIEVSVSKNDKKDFGAITFGENGSTGFENGWDVSKMIGSEDVPHIYFEAEANRYCQNHLESLKNNTEQTVNMHFLAGETGEQTLSVNLEFLPDAYVLLEDLFTNQMIDLLKNPVYTFAAKKDDNTDRFRLHFKYSLTGIEDNIASASSTIDVYASNKAVFITNKEDNSYESAKIAVYDIYGRALYSTKTQLGNVTRIPVNISNSYLVVRVVKGNEIYTEKVFIK